MKPILISDARSRLWTSVGLLLPVISVLSAAVLTKIVSLSPVVSYLEWVAALPTIVFFIPIVVFPAIALWLSISVYRVHHSGKVWRFSRRLIAISTITLILEATLVLLNVFYLS